MRKLKTPEEIIYKYIGLTGKNHKAPIDYDECVKIILTAQRDALKCYNDQWVNVNDALPEKDVNVLCYSYGDMIEGYFCSVDNCFKPELDDIGYMSENDTMVIDVTYWMPLPKMPK